MIKNIEIKISELSLWDENPRFPDKYYNQTEEELIDYFVKKKNFKIKELAESIVTDFSLPQLEKMVVLDLQDQYIVIEGNRRLTIYKLLVSPELAKDDKLKKLFSELSTKISIDSNFELECVVTSTKDEALKYVDRKHNNNNFEINWGQAERDNFKARRGRASNKELFRIEMSKIVKKLDIPEELKEQVLGKGYVTTFFRIIDSKPSYELHGFSFDDGKLIIEDDDFKEKLKVIVYNVLTKETLDGDKKVYSRTLNKNPEKEEYLKSIKKEDSKKVDEIIKQHTQKDIFGGEKLSIPKISKSPKRTPKTPRTQKDIDNLFGGDLQLIKSDTNDIYRDIIDLYKFYISKKDTLSKSFPSLIRMALRLLVESATEESQSIQDYVKLNFDSAKKGLSKNHKTTLSNNSIKGQKELIQLLHSGAHNYTNSANFEQTIVMSIIIGEMLKITHNKK